MVGVDEGGGRWQEEGGAGRRTREMGRQKGVGRRGIGEYGRGSRNERMMTRYMVREMHHSDF